MTSIKKRGKFYWIDYYHGGKRKRQSLKTDRLLEAQDRTRQIEEKLRQIETGPLLEDFAKTYFEWAKSTKPASVEREFQRWDKIVLFLKSENVLTLKTIAPLIVEKLRAKLIEDKLSRSTVNRYLQLLRGMFYRAKDWDLYQGENPLRKVKFFREESSVRVPSATEINRIREAAQAISAKPHSKLQAAFSSLVEFALNTGMRKSEILNLKWSDIQDGEAYIRGKGDRIRKVPLNRAALTIIEAQARIDDYVFNIPNRRQPDLLRRTVLMAGKKAELSWNFHQLRHRFASDLLERGVDVVTTAAILGHTRPTTTLIYSHTSREQKRRAVELLDLCPSKKPQTEGEATGSK